MTATFSCLSEAAPPVAPAPPPSLKTVSVPPVEGIEQYITNNQVAIALGKALFWDIAMGSDGQSCASCHFSAGADSRTKNQLNPSMLNQDPVVATTFTKPMQSGGVGGPNYTLKLSDFPFIKFNDPSDRESGILWSTDDVTSSAGTFAGEFVSITPELFDECNRKADDVFNVDKIGARKVEPRNTPTMINAVFNFRNFWDGRANNRFNGVDPFGDRNVDARILVLQPDGVTVTPTQISLKNSSLASQAVGPPQSDFEAGCSGRSLADIGRKLLVRRALSLQKINKNDSVLATYKPGATDPIPGDDTAPNVIIADLVDGLLAPRTKRGLKYTYAQLVQLAFNPNLWSVEGAQFTVDGRGPYTQMEANFSLIWGLAVQAYESTLISNDAPYDKFVEGDSTALTASQQRGLDIFLNQGKCINCHKGPEFTGAATSLQPENQEGGLVERMLINDGGLVMYDNAFYNISVTPTDNDVGVGGHDKFGNPLSFTKQFVNGQKVDPFEVDPCKFDQQFTPCDALPDPLSGERIAIQGAFKVPSLRNVELTGPYMHNGSMATLEQVVEFYNRGGNFSNQDVDLTTDAAKDPDIQPLGLSADEQTDLVAFLKSLTDSRVAWEKAPFDHPHLIVPNGQEGDENSVVPMADPTVSFLGKSQRLVIPAIGKNGRSAKQGPLRPFSETLAP